MVFKLSRPLQSFFGIISYSFTPSVCRRNRRDKNRFLAIHSCECAIGPLIACYGRVFFFRPSSWIKFSPCEWPYDGRILCFCGFFCNLCKCIVIQKARLCLILVISQVSGINFAYAIYTLDSRFSGTDSEVSKWIAETSVICKVLTSQFS